MTETNDLSNQLDLHIKFLKILNTKSPKHALQFVAGNNVTKWAEDSIIDCLATIDDETNINFMTTYLSDFMKNIKTNIQIVLLNEAYLYSGQAIKFVALPIKVSFALFPILLGDCAYINIYYECVVLRKKTLRLKYNVSESEKIITEVVINIVLAILTGWIYTNNILLKFIIDTDDEVLQIENCRSIFVDIIEAEKKFYENDFDGVKKIIIKLLYPIYRLIGDELSYKESLEDEIDKYLIILKELLIYQPSIVEWFLHIVISNSFNDYKIISNNDKEQLNLVFIGSDFNINHISGYVMKLSEILDPAYENNFYLKISFGDCSDQNEYIYIDQSVRLNDHDVDIKRIVKHISLRHAHNIYIEMDKLMRDIQNSWEDFIENAGCVVNSRVDRFEEWLKIVTGVYDLRDGLFKNNKLFGVFLTFLYHSPFSKCSDEKIKSIVKKYFFDKQKNHIPFELLRVLNDVFDELNTLLDSIKQNKKVKYDYKQKMANLKKAFKNPMLNFKYVKYEDLENLTFQIKHRDANNFRRDVMGSVLTVIAERESEAMFGEKRSYPAYRIINDIKKYKNNQLDIWEDPCVEDTATSTQGL
jgi:hypothetical protein